MEHFNTFQPIRPVAKGAQSRNIVLSELDQSEDYLVVVVNPRNEQGIKPIALHISKLSAVGPALFKLLLDDTELCSALSDLTHQVKRYRQGLSTPWVPIDAVGNCDLPASAVRIDVPESEK